MRTSSTQSGSALLVSAATIVILSLISATAIKLILGNRATLSQSASWQAALVAAESGAHQGIAQAHEQLLPLLNQTTPPNLSGSQTLRASLSHSGEGVTNTSAEYVLSGVYHQVGVAGSASRPYFSIVSTGSCGISGGKRAASRDGRDSVLRKLTLAGSAPPAATRQVEVWLRPVYSTDAAITTDGLIRLNNHNITVDSFNSRDPKRSPGANTPYANLNDAPIGYYNARKINGSLDRDYYNASVGTNGALIMGGGSYIFGDAMTNGGVTTNAQNVHGIIRDDFYQPLAPVQVPDGNFVYPTAPKGQGNQTTVVTAMNNNTQLTLKGGTKANPARYKLDRIRITGGGLLTFALGQHGNQGTINPEAKYVELYVSSDFVTKGGGNGDGSVNIPEGIQVKIYVGGDIAIGGNGIVNGNNSASSLSILGITPKDGSPRSADFGGTSTFFGTVYAPAYDLKLGGTPTYVGSLVGKTATLVGNVSVRYDEALGGSGVITRFAVASWFENSKKL